MNQSNSSKKNVPFEIPSFLTKSKSTKDFIMSRNIHSSYPYKSSYKTKPVSTQLYKNSEQDLMYSTNQNFFKTQQQLMDKNNLNAFNKTMSTINFKKTTNSLANKDLVKEFSNYLDSLQKESKNVEKFSRVNRTTMEKLLKQNNENNKIVNDFFTKSNESEYELINKLYHEGHALNNVYRNNEKLFEINNDHNDYMPNFNKKKNMIKNNLTEQEIMMASCKPFNKENSFTNIYNNNIKEKTINNFLNSKNRRSNTLSSKLKRTESKAFEFHNSLFFRNPVDSYSAMKLNKELFDKIQEKMNEEQIRAFMEKYYENEENYIKNKLMPKIIPIPLHKEKPGKEPEKPTIVNKLIENSYLTQRAAVDIATSERKLLFDNYHTISIKNVGSFISTLPSRIGSKMAQYYDEKTNETVLLVFGGMNRERLNELWEIRVNKHNVGNQKFKWTQITDTKGDIPLPRIGHSFCLYKNEIVIYGGILSNENTYNYRDDILRYFPEEKRWFSSNCGNKGGVTWRRYHTAEVIGQYLFIYGGEDENCEAISDPWALDLRRFRWVACKFTEDSILPKLHHLCSELVFPAAKLFHPKFSLFKSLNKFKGLPIIRIRIKQEGIYLFGGLNEFRQATNDVYIIKRGRPLTMIKANIQGLPPKPRYDCTMNYYERLNVLIIHGGKNEGDPQGQTFYNDFYFIDIERLTWIKLDVYKDFDDEVYCRSSHCAEIVGDELIIFGGYNDKSFVTSNLMVCSLDVAEVKSEMRYKKKYLKNNERENNANDNNKGVGKKIVSKKKCTTTDGTVEKKIIHNEEEFNEDEYENLNKKINQAKTYFDKFSYEKIILQNRFDEIESLQYDGNSSSLGLNKYLKNNIDS